MNKSNFKYVLVLINLIFLFLVLLLSFKIFKISRARNKIKYISSLDKKNYILGESTSLRYFYEPKANLPEKYIQPWSKKIIVNKINADSLNENVDYQIAKPSNAYRILTIGDSFTYGLYVETNNNFSEKLELKLNKELQCNDFKKFEVINLGVSGYDVEYVLERLKTRGIKYSPDLVIWLLNEWNFERISEYMNPIIEQLRNDGRKEYNINKNKYHLIYFEALEKIKKKYSEIELFNYQVKRFINLSNIYNGNMLIVSFSGRLDIYKMIIAELINKNNKYLYNDNLNNYWFNGLLRFPDDHPNEKGHEEIADSLFKYLTENYLNNCIIKN